MNAVSYKPLDPAHTDHHHPVFSLWIVFQVFKKQRKKQRLDLSIGFCNLRIHWAIPTLHDAWVQLLIVKQECGQRMTIFEVICGTWNALELFVQVAHRSSVVILHHGLGAFEVVFATSEICRLTS